MLQHDRRAQSEPQDERGHDRRRIHSRDVSRNQRHLVPSSAWFRFDSRKSIQRSQPAPDRVDSSSTSMPGRTASMFARACARSKSPAPRRSSLVRTATSDELKMVGYLSGLSSPSVTEKSTALSASPRSNEAGQTRFPTFSMKRKSSGRSTIAASR